MSGERPTAKTPLERAEADIVAVQVRLLTPDLTPEGIVRELNLLKGSTLLRGFRGSPALDVGAVADIIARIGALLRAEPAILEIDLNPVIVYPQGQGAIALDALMLVHTPEGAVSGSISPGPMAGDDMVRGLRESCPL